MKILIIPGIILLSYFNLFAVESDINKEPNTIHLIGEIHDDKECIKFKDALKKDANDEKIILALEGWGFREDNKNHECCNVFGIEDLQIVCMNEAFDGYIAFNFYKSMQDLINEEDILGDILEDFLTITQKRLDRFSDPESALMSYITGDHPHSDLLKNFCDANNSLMDWIACKKANQLNKKQLFRTPDFLKVCEDISLWIDLFKDITHSFLHTIVQKKTISQLMQNEIISYMTKFEEYAIMDLEKRRNLLLTLINDHDKAFNFMVDSLCFGLRNPIFLKNIISIFENNKSQEKPFYVIIGAGHAPFLYKELKQQGYNIEFNNLAAEEILRELIKDKDLKNKKSTDDMVKFALNRLLDSNPLKMQNHDFNLIIALLDNELINLDQARVINDYAIKRLRNSLSLDLQISIIDLLIHPSLQIQLNIDADDRTYLKNYAFTKLTDPKSTLILQKNIISLLDYLLKHNLLKIDADEQIFLKNNFFRILRNSSCELVLDRLVLQDVSISVLDRLLRMNLLIVDTDEAEFLKNLVIKTVRDFSAIRRLDLQFLTTLIERNLIKVNEDEATFLKPYAIDLIKDPKSSYFSQDTALFFLSFIVQPHELFPLTSEKLFEHLLNYVIENKPKFSALRTQNLLNYYKLFLNHTDPQIQSLAANISALL
ncbi:MAG: hypothetical protein C5B43_01055 [Verrucomicrobia bacterium]|nr:MAG: hypothetical protein C5B43_01055 [Verrucomicrobiota bacterium]